MRISFNRGVLVGALLALDACRDPTGPNDRLSIVLSTSDVQAPVISPTPGGRRVACSMVLTARADGSGKATWVDGVLRFNYGTGAARQVQELSMRVTDSTAWWGRTVIIAGQSQQVRFEASSDAPFAGELELRYRPDSGTVKSTTATFQCGPKAESTTAPTISGISIAPASGRVNPESRILVTYALNASAGIWETRVTASGACTVVKTTPGKFETTLSRTDTLTLPAACKLGQQLAISVAATDALLQTTTHATGTSLTVVDTIPPIVSVSYFQQGLAGYQPVPSNDVFAGANLNIQVGAHDNYKLGSVVWEWLPAGIRDSVRLTTNDLDLDPKPIKIPDALSGPVQLRFFARDSIGLTSAESLTPPDSIRVMPTVKKPGITRPYPFDVIDFRIDEPRGVIYVALSTEQRIDVVSLTTLQVLRSIDVDARPQGIDITPGGDSLVVTLFRRNYLLVVDLRAAAPAMSQLSIASMIDPTPGLSAMTVRTLSNGHAVLTLADPQTGVFRLADVDLATGVAHRRTEVTIEFNGISIERSHDHRTIATSPINGGKCVQKYSVSTDAFTACGQARANVRPSLDLTGGLVAIGGDTFDANLNPLPRATHNTVTGNAQSAISPDGRLLYFVMGINGIVVASAANGTIQSRIIDPSWNLSPFAFIGGLVQLSRSGTKLVATAVMNGSIYLIATSIP